MSPRHSSKWVMATGALTAFVLNLDQATVLLSSSSIADSLGADLADTQWMFTGFLLPLAAFVLLGGGLSDRFDPVRILRLGLGVFLAGTIGSMFASSMGLLIGMRVLAGLGASLAFPASVSLLRVLLPPGPQSSLALGLWFSGALGGSALGPLIGGSLLGVWSWWSIFALSAVFALTALAPVFLVIRRTQASGSGAELRLFPSVMGAVGLALVAWGLINAGQNGWLSLVAQFPLLLGLSTLIALALRLYFTRAPSEAPEFNSRQLFSGLATMLLAILPVVGTMFMVVTYLQRILDFSQFEAGAAFMPFGLVAAFVAPFSVRLLTRFGTWRMLMAAILFEAASLLLLSGATPSTRYAIIGVALGLGGCAMAIFPAVSLHMVLEAAPRVRSGLVTGAHTVALQIGQLLSIGVMGSLVASRVGGVYRSLLAQGGLDADVPESVVSDLSFGISNAPAGVPAGEAPVYERIGEEAFMASVSSSIVLLLTIIAAISAAVVLILRIGRRSSSPLAALRGNRQ